MGVQITNQRHHLSNVTDLRWGGGAVAARCFEFDRLTTGCFDPGTFAVAHQQVVMTRGLTGSRDADTLAAVGKDDTRVT